MLNNNWIDHEEYIQLSLPMEFRFDENLIYLSRSPNECMFEISNNRIYRVIPVEKETPLVEISSENDRYLTIRFLGNAVPIDKRIREKVALYVREWFDLDTDIVPFYKLAEDDPLLKKPFSSYYGLRLVGIPDLFEALCWGIIGQQINLPFAYTLKRRFVESFGKFVEWKDKNYWVFPSPERIAGLKVEDLTQLKMTTRKSEYLIGIAKLITEGVLTKNNLMNSYDFKTAEKLLVNIRGIGPWTANYVLMRCLRYPSAFPIDDVGLHNAIKHLTGSSMKPTKEEIKELAKVWAHWEAYATFYLWRVLY